MDKRLSSHKATMEIVKKHDFKFTWTEFFDR